MRNTGLEETQAGIKIARRNINNLRYADDTTLMAESEEALKSLLMNLKEESEKAGLKPNIQKTNIMASGSITSWQTGGETMETVTDFISWESQITDTILFILIIGFSRQEYLSGLPFPSPHFVRTLHYDPSFLGGPTWHSS